MIRTDHLQLLSDYLDGQLDAPAQRELESRLLKEPALAAAMAALASLRGALQDPTPLPAPPLAWTLKAMALVQPRSDQKPGWLMAGLAAGLGHRRRDVAGHSPRTRSRQVRRRRQALPRRLR